MRYYVDHLASDPDALRASFAFYRTLDTTAAQNEQRKGRRLTLPVLAIAGAANSGALVADTMRLGADDVNSLIIPDCGHHPTEEAPEALLTGLIPFLAPYRDGADEERMHSPSAGR